MASFAVPDEQTITEANVYLLGPMLVIRQERMDAAAEGFGWEVTCPDPATSVSA